MKKAIESQLSSFEAIFDMELAGFCLKRLVYALIPLAFFIFAASRIHWAFLRNIIAGAGVLWAYLVLLISAGCLCRAIFIKYIRKSPLDLKACHAFSMTFAPAYLLVPLVILIAGAFIRSSALFLIYIGSIMYVGEIILGIIIIPVVLITILSTLIFAMALYLAPAIIAAEEEGFTYVFKRILSILNYIPVRFILYLITGIFFTKVVMLAFAGLLALSLPDLAGIVTGALKLKAFQLGMSIPGTFVFDLDGFYVSVPFTYHIFAFFAYISFSVILALVFFIPCVFACSSAVHIYRLIRTEEIDAVDAGNEPLIRGKGIMPSGAADRIVCPHCKETVKGGLFFCTQCGQKLNPDDSNTMI